MKRYGQPAIMIKNLLLVLACLLTSPIVAAAQTRPTSLAELFQDVFGPNGLVVSSDDVQLDGTTHGAHFNSSFQSDFRLMNIAVAEQLTAVPLPSPASGFTYKFDPSTGTFVRSSTSFGPILADRGETIGRHRMAFGSTYQFISFDRLDGVSLSDVPAVFRHDAYQSTPGRSDVIATANTIQATVTQFTAAITYGLTDRIDVSAAVPVVRTRVSLLSNAIVERVGTGPDLGVHYFYDPTALGSHGTAHQYYASGDAGGMGDVLLRVKGTVMREGRRALAAGVDARLPTGDELNLLGSGAFGVRPFAALSATYGPVAPHVNVAYQWNGRSVLAGDVTAGVKGGMPDQFQYAAGADVTVSPRLNLIFDLLGQRLLQSPRLSTFPFVATGPYGSVPLRDLQFQTASFWTGSGSIGLKANVAPKVLINLNLRFAVGRAGLTDRLTPLAGVEWAF
jgi:hypothetical protein